MTRRQLIIPVTFSGTHATGNTGDLGEVASFARLVIAVNVTVVTSLTSLNIFLNMQDPVSLAYVRCKTRAMGINANGSFTEGDFSLGDFATITSATAVPYTEIRGLSASDAFTSRIRVEWVVVGTSPTFSLSVTGDTEEGA